MEEEETAGAIAEKARSTRQSCRTETRINRKQRVEIEYTLERKRGEEIERVRVTRENKRLGENKLREGVWKN